jgi:hypothetical protein
MRRLAVFAIAGLAAVSGLFAPATGRGDVIGATAAFTLRGSHGYRITVMAFSRRADGRGEILVFARRKHSSVMYTAPANVTDAHMEADLGHLGDIDVQFVASGGVESERSECGGEAIQFEAGAYVGTIEFHGEEGYTEASSASAAPEYKPFLDQICAGGGSSESIGRGLPGARLLIRSPRRHLSVKINENRPGAKMRYSAEMDEQSGRISISRSVEGALPGRAFEFSTDLKSAKLDPPAPFARVAKFTRDAAKPHRWTGSLTIDFPGRSHVPLTGAGVTATLVPARFTLDQPHGP